LDELEKKNQRKNRGSKQWGIDRSQKVTYSGEPFFLLSSFFAQFGSVRGSQARAALATVAIHRRKRAAPVIIPANTETETRVTTTPIEKVKRKGKKKRFESQNRTKSFFFSF
jgi:hypothetical protein